MVVLHKWQCGGGKSADHANHPFRIIDKRRTPPGKDRETQTASARI
jgi:hypothetical protein